MRFFLLLSLCLICSCERKAVEYNHSVHVDVILDEGFIAQQNGITERIKIIRDDLTWEYKKGAVITKNIIVGTVVVAVIAGTVVVLANGGNVNLNVSSSSANAKPNGLKLVFSNSNCSQQYGQLLAGLGKSEVAFFAPQESEIYIFSVVDDIKYSLGSFRTNNTKTKATLKLVTASIETEYSNLP
jgi:hypothetical protein